MKAPHYLNRVDQFALRLHQFGGRNQLIQAVWIYEQEISNEKIRDFHACFSRSIAGRLVRLSLLPFGRPRWVQGSSRTHPVVFSEKIMPRSSMLTWADQQAKSDIDPIEGAGWILAVQRFDDGATAISIVCSHAIGDGIGGIMAMHEAMNGRIHSRNYDPYLSGPSWISILQDAFRTTLDLPAACIAAFRAIPLVVKLRLQRSSTTAAHAAVKTPEEIELPRLICSIDSKAWRRQARQRGGSAYALLAALTVHLAEAYGRQRQKDGAVTLLLPINSRTSLEDDRAIAFDFAKLNWSPYELENDLSDLNRSLAYLTKRSSDQSGLSALTFLPLIPFLPRSWMRIFSEALFDYSEDLPVTCSNLGQLPASFAHLAGPEAGNIFLRGIDSRVTSADLERTKGHLVVVASRIGNRYSIAIEAYELDAINTTDRLVKTVTALLQRYGLEATIEC